ncbi:MAG: 3-ketoacyl-ACP reductase [Paracoccus sp. (in: a-proteobacteria)]|nr:3-ketoacyl-ACP reductase [Paracoccus sp. (in: a-proteobacteria)]
MSAPVALITGGQQGIGLGIARALSDEGFALVLVAEQPADAPAVMGALEQLPAGTRYFRHDLREIGAVEALLDGVGRVDVLVGNAGVPARSRGDLLEMTPDSFDFCMDINLRGNFFLAQAVARRMLAAPAGAGRAMIFVTSVSAALASPERGEYCMSKAAASMMVQLFALRLAGAGIGVFELRPGIIETAMTAGVRGKYDAAIAGGLVPAGRWGQPGDIGSVAAALARGQFAFATGAVIAVDGGLSVPRL